MNTAKDIENVKPMSLEELARTFPILTKDCLIVLSFFSYYINNLSESPETLIEDFIRDNTKYIQTKDEDGNLLNEGLTFKAFEPIHKLSDTIMKAMNKHAQERMPTSKAEEK